MLFHFFPFYLFILRQTYCSNIITVMYFDATNVYSYLYFLGDFSRIKMFKEKCHIFKELIVGLLFYWIDFKYIW